MMNLRILLPYQIFSETAKVTRIVAEAPGGSFGLLPHRLDCVTALVPGIFSYESEEQGEVFLAIDEGVLVKTGYDVVVSVRNAVGGTDLEHLREVVETDFQNLTEQDQRLRFVMAKVESGLSRRLAEFHHE